MMDLGDAAGYKSKSQTDIIASYISDWIQVQYFYEQAASIAHEICEAALSRHEIRAIVTHRVKASNRLEAKLRERVRKKRKTYRTADDIRDDIVDLAGVRIALYFPSDREKIVDIINEEFSVLESKIFPEKLNEDSTNDGTPDYKARFMGYSADHYRVRIIADKLATKKLREDFQKSNPMIEIQVASVLMHAWAEIDHDLVYKTLTSGIVSDQERRLLDAANGLVRTGEVLLQQLQIAMKGRVAYQKKPFQDHYKLGEFLRDEIKLDEDRLDYLGIVLQVLRILKLDSPWILGKKLTGFMAEPKKKDPMDLAILEHILRSLEGGQESGDESCLKPRPVVPEVIIHLDFDKDNKRYAIDANTRKRILLEAETLIRAVQIIDILRMPEKSVLSLTNMTSEFRELIKLHHDVNTMVTLLNRAFQDDHERWVLSAEWRKSSKFDRADHLWAWFEKNSNIYFRLALLLARLNKPEIATGLKEWQQRSNTPPRNLFTPAMPKLDTSFRSASRRTYSGPLKRASTINTGLFGAPHMSTQPPNPTLWKVPDLPRSPLRLRRTESPASLRSPKSNGSKVNEIITNGIFPQNHDIILRDFPDVRAEEAELDKIFNELDAKQVGIITRRAFLEWLRSNQMSAFVPAIPLIDDGGFLNRDEFAKSIQYIKKLNLQKTDRAVSMEQDLDASVEDVGVNQGQGLANGDTQPRRPASR